LKVTNDAEESSMKKLLTHFSVGLILLGAMATGNVLAYTLIATDSSWKVTATDPNPSNWFSSTTFDDSAWQNATELYDLNALGYPQWSPAKGIWTDDGQFSLNDAMWARFTFNLDSVPLSALLTNGFDDDGDLYINGTQVVNDHNGSANNSFADITSYLVAGNNLIAYMVTDNWQVWGHQHSSWVHVEAVAAAVPEPEIYAMLGVGLGLMGWVGRRRKLQAA
jgi:hypothetical protein